MNRNHLIAFVAVAAVLGIIAFVAYTFFEIYPTEKFKFPSREVIVNDYLALDRWLEGAGRPVRDVRFANQDSISQAKEKNIFIQSSLFYWTEEAVEFLVHWIEEGGNLFLSIDSDSPGHEYDIYSYSDEPIDLIAEFGIDMDIVYNEAFRFDSNAPSYDRYVAFELSRSYYDEVLVLGDNSNIARLVRVKQGKGTLTVTGSPRFLRSSNLDDAPNARLAWALFLSDGEKEGLAEDGWFFIRGRGKAQGLIGSLFRQGNLVVLIVSAIVLIIICFWRFLPVFGLLRGDDERPGKPLRERFLAEGRFLKQYNALKVYQESYVKEIKRRFARKEGITSDDEIEKRVLKIWGKSDRGKNLLVGALRGEEVSYSELPGMITILKTILERL